MLILVAACAAPLESAAPTAPGTGSPIASAGQLAATNSAQNSPAVPTASPQTLIATPTPTEASATPPDAARWKALGTAFNVANPTLAWSPDGGHLVVSRNETNGPPEDQFIDVFDADGNLVQAYQGYDEAQWLDDQTLVMTTWKRGQGGSIDYGKGYQARGQSFMVTLGSDPQPIAVDLAGGESSGHGAIGFETDKGTAVWTADEGVSAWTPDSYPERWSLDGTRLDIEHSFGHPGESWPQIVTWPGLSTIASDEAVLYRKGEGAINLDLTMSATWEWSADVNDPSPVNAQIIDLDSGEKTPLNFVAPPGLSIWGRTDLVVSGDKGGDTVAYAPDGSAIERWPGLTGDLTVSRDGLSIVFTSEESQTTQIAVLRDGHVVRIVPPGKDIDGVYSNKISPDGSRLAVVCISGFNQETAYLTKLD